MQGRFYINFGRRSNVRVQAYARKGEGVEQIAMLQCYLKSQTAHPNGIILLALLHYMLHVPRKRKSIRIRTNHI